MSQPIFQSAAPYQEEVLALPVTDLDATSTWYSKHFGMTEVKRFDARALHQALDEQRIRRGMSWTDVSREIGVSASTLRRTKDGGRMEVDGMIAMVYWLDEKVETFIKETLT